MAIEGLIQQLEFQDIAESAATIKALVNKGESLEVEFKDDSKGSFSDAHVYESVVAMTNTKGGVLLIGVSNAGQFSGCKRIANGTWKNVDAIQGMILGNTLPACAVAVSIQKIDGIEIVVMRIPQSASTTGTTGGKFLKRINNAKGQPQNMPMSADDIMGGIARIGIQDFSSTVLSGSTLDYIDLGLVQETALKRSAQVSDAAMKELLQQSAQGVLNACGLINIDGKPNIGGMLLFGKSEVIREKLPNHAIQFQVFGQRGEILKNQSFVGPIAKIFPQLLNVPELLRNSDEFRLRGAAVTLPEYPEDSRREALANAIVHRDYAYHGGTQIQLYEKELVITNPGSFPQGVTLTNLLSASPTPRNRRLAEAMKFFGFVESSGRGIDYIFQGQARFGRPAPDYSASDNFKVSVRLAGGKANLDFCKFLFSSLENPTVLEVLLLNALFFKRDLSLLDAAAVIQKPPTVTQEILFKMNQDRLVEITSDKPSKYLLKGSLHRTVRKAIKPARLSKDQVGSFKQILLNELGRNSPNSASNLADLAGLSNSQTWRLLAQLKKEKKVKLLPNKKWAIV